jgi:hypothetical protein
MENIIKQIRNDKNKSKNETDKQVGPVSKKKVKLFVPDPEDQESNTEPTLEQAIVEKLLKGRKINNVKQPENTPCKKPAPKTTNKKINCQPQQQEAKNKKINCQPQQQEAKEDGRYSDFLYIKGELIYETYMSWIHPDGNYPEFADLSENEQTAWTKAVSLDFNKSV